MSLFQYTAHFDWFAVSRLSIFKLFSAACPHCPSDLILQSRPYRLAFIESKALFLLFKKCRY